MRRSVGSGVEELVFLGWLTPVLAVVGLVAIRGRRGLALVLGLAALVPCLLALGANLPGYETVWRIVPGLEATRVPERLMPIACLAIAGLAAFGIDATRARLATIGYEPSAVAGVGTLAVLAVVLALDLRVPVFGAVAADTPNAAYAAMRGPGRLLELPVFRPDIHFGSAYLGYARQSPRERPQGYSTVAPRAASRLGLAAGPSSAVAVVRARGDPRAGRARRPHVRRGAPGPCDGPERLLRPPARRPEASPRPRWRPARAVPA